MDKSTPHSTHHDMLAQLCTRRTCDSKGPVLLQASAGGGRLVSSCRSSNAGHVRPPATPPIWAEWAGAKTQTFEQHTGCTWQSMLAICHSVHTCTPRQLKYDKLGSASPWNLTRYVGSVVCDGTLPGSFHLCAFFPLSEQRSVC